MQISSEHFVISGILQNYVFGEDGSWSKFVCTDCVMMNILIQLMRSTTSSALTLKSERDNNIIHYAFRPSPLQREFELITNLKAGWKLYWLRIFELFL